MEAFALLKFWKTSNSKVAAGATVNDGDTVAESTFSDPLTEESDDDDDSFFELELTMPNYDSKFPKPDFSTKKFEQEREIDLKPTSKPQSPISILRSAPPKLKVFMFGKLNRKKSKQEEFEFESLSSPNFSPKGNNNNNSNLFTVKFKIEDGSIVPKFTRSNSSSLITPNETSYETSRRFSKDVVQKYLNLIKPRSSRKFGEAEKFAPSPTRSTTASFPSPRKEKEEKQSSSSRFKVKCKHLGKSKSASSVIGAPSPAVRNDHPHDGIEGAILHCKRSLNSSKGHSSLSRCSSDPSHEKSNQVSERPPEGRREEK